MKREHLLLLFSVILTLGAALGLLRWLAPQLLGLPVDLQMVAVAREVPPFYGNIFRDDDARSKELSLPDPVVGTRSRPLLAPGNGQGPNDLLGFRNRAIPVVADIVTIGDSQTYGNNALLEETWPVRLQAQLSDRRATVYNMSAGGWGAPQYLEMVPHALRLQPRLLVVAFYSGNDPLDSFKLVYGSEQWRSLRVDRNARAGDMPAVAYPPPPETRWPVQFRAGPRMVFTPVLRHAANDRSQKAVRTGWAIMAEVVRRIAAQAQQQQVPVIFTIVPTKELVYARLVERDHITHNPAYTALLHDEQENIRELARVMAQTPGARYVDLVAPMQAAAMQIPATIYRPDDINGHPEADGYRVMAQALALPTGPLLPPPPRGVVMVRTADGDLPFLVNREGAWIVLDRTLLTANGWNEASGPPLPERALATLPMKGPLEIIDPVRFGPTSVQP